MRGFDLDVALPLLVAFGARSVKPLVQEVARFPTFCKGILNLEYEGSDMINAGGASRSAKEDL